MTVLDPEGLIRSPLQPAIRSPIGPSSGTTFALDATATAIRAAILDPASFASGGWRLPGLAGARLSASARASVAMQQRVDGGWEFAPHNLLLNSDVLGTQSVSTVVGAQYTLSIVGTGSVALSGGASGTLAGTGASNRESLTFNATTTSVTFTVTGSVTQGALSLGASVVAYVPTTTTAVYGPAIDWLTGIGAYGLRSEEARTNLALWSSDLTNAVWNQINPGVGVLPVKTLVAGAGPDNGAATRLQLDCGNVGSAVNRSAVLQSITIANATAYSTSVWLKAFDAGNVGKTVHITSDSVGTVVATLTAAWQRVSLTGTSNGTASNVIVETRGTYTTQTADVLVWCPQLEQGSFATSPILTYGASATRAGDDITGTLISPTVGTYVFDYINAVVTGAQRSLLNHDNGTAYVAPSAMLVRVNPNRSVDAGGDASSLTTATLGSTGATNRLAVAFAVGGSPEYAASLNGGTVATLASSDYTGVGSTRMRLGNGTNGVLNGHIVRARRSVSRLPDATLQALTA